MPSFNLNNPKDYPSAINNCITRDELHLLDAFLNKTYRLDGAEESWEKSPIALILANDSLSYNYKVKYVKTLIDKGANIDDGANFYPSLIYFFTDAINTW
jgi:hypothetical protein